MMATTKKLLESLTYWEVLNLAQIFSESGRRGSEEVEEATRTGEIEGIRPALLKIQVWQLQAAVRERAADYERKGIPLSHFQVLEVLLEKLGE